MSARYADPQRGHDRRAPQQPAPPEAPRHRQHAPRVAAVAGPQPEEGRGDQRGEDEVAVEAAPRVGAELLDGVRQQVRRGEGTREGADEEEPRGRGHESGDERAPPAVAWPAHLVHVGTRLRLGCRDRHLARPGLLPLLAVPRPPARHLDEGVDHRVRRPARQDAHLGLEQGEDEEGVRGEREDLGTGIRRGGLDDPAVPLERPDRVRRRGVRAEVRAGERHPAGEGAEPAVGDGGHEALLALEAAGERGDDDARSRAVDLLVGGRRTQHRPEELHDGVLEPAARAEERHALLARPPDGPEDGLVVGVGGPRDAPRCRRTPTGPTSWAPSWAPTRSRRRARAGGGSPPARGDRGGRPGRPRGRCARSWPHSAACTGRDLQRPRPETRGARGRGPPRSTRMPLRHTAIPRDPPLRALGRPIAVTDVTSSSGVAAPPPAACPARPRAHPSADRLRFL